MAFFYNLPVKFNKSGLAFNGVRTQNHYKGLVFGNGFNTSPINDTFTEPARIELEVKNNPRLMAILNEYNIPLKVNLGELEKLTHGHLKDTRVVVAKMYSQLPDNLKKQVNLKDLQDAAMYHDYGKALIPKNILNKKGALNPKEREIIEQHAEIGYELLKNSGLNDRVLNLIKYHHQLPNGEGYPPPDDDFAYSVELQILNVADKYSALSEERSYKPALSRKESLEIIHKDVLDGLVTKEIFDTLVRATG